MPNGEDHRDARSESEALMQRAFNLERTNALPLALESYRQAVALYRFNTEAQMQIIRIARDLGSKVTDAEVDEAATSILIWGTDEQQTEVRDFLDEERVNRIIESIVDDADNIFNTCAQYPEDQALRSSFARFLDENGDI